MLYMKRDMNLEKNDRVLPCVCVLSEHNVYGLGGGIFDDHVAGISHREDSRSMYPGGDLV